MRKILYISENFFKGGANKAGFRYFSSLNVEVDVFNIDTFKPSNYIVIKLLYLQKLFEKIISRLLKLDENIDFNLIGRISFKSINNYNTIIVNNMGHGFLSWGTLFRLRRKNLIFINHDFYFFNGLLHYPSGFILTNFLQFYILIFKYFLKRLSYNNQVHFIFPSIYLSNKFNNMGFKNIKTEVLKIPFGYIKSSRTKCDKLKILIIADSLSNFRKGFDRIIKFIEKYQFEYEFNIVGDGFQKYEIQNVNSLGYISDELKLKDIYAGCDVLLIPSRQDNAPLVALEAIENGCYVIYSNNNGLIEYLDSNNGLICNFDDEISIINSLNKITTLKKNSIFEIEKKLSLNDLLHTN